LAIILQPKFDLACETVFTGPLGGYGVLFVRKRYACHIGIELACEMQGHAAPTGSDVENLEILAVHDELGRDVAFLRQLSLLEIVRGILEIGA